MQKIIYYLTLSLIISIIAYKPAAAHNYCKNGLIAYWTFDDGTAKDVSGNDFHGTIMNSPQRIKGVSGDAFYFTGRGYFSTGINSVPEGDHILLPRIPFEELGEFSLTLWVKEDGMSNAAGEGYFFFGDHVNGWLGLMNVKQYDAADTILYTDYAVGASEDVPALKQLFDFDERAKWIFYTMTYKNGVLTAYRDGKYLVQTNQTINIQNVDIGAIARHWWKWGSDIRTSARFSGAIDEVKLFCKALTDEEVMEEYKTCEEKNIDKLEIAESPKPQKKFTLDFGKVTLNDEKSVSINIKNISSELATIYKLDFKNKNFYVAPGTTPLTLAPTEAKELKIFFKKNIIGLFKDEFKIKDVCSEYTVELQAEVKANPCKNGLIAYWSFDDSTAKDNSGNGYDGTIMNNPRFVNGYRGKGIRLHGDGNFTTEEPKGSYVLLPNIQFIDYNEFTVSLAAYEESFSYYAGEAMLWFGLHNSGWLGLMTHNIDGDDKGERYTHYSISSGKDGKIAYKAPFDTLSLRNKWIYYTMTYSNGVVKCYRNGTLLSQMNQTVTVLDTFAAIGRHWWVADNQLRSSARYNGIIDEVKIYCKALSQEEINNEVLTCANADLDELEITEVPKPTNQTTITFPSSKVNEEKYTSIHIKNKTDRQYLIKNISFQNNNFRFDAGVFPLTLAPNSTKELRIYFKKSEKGIFHDQFVITDICSQYTVNLIAEVIGAPCLNGLMAYWSFDDSTANDQSGNGYHGAFRNNPIITKGIKGNGIELQGKGNYYVGEPAGSYVSLPNLPFDEFNEFTIGLVAKEKSFSYNAGEAMIWFGTHNNGWLGLMNGYYEGNDQASEAYTHYSVFSNSYAKNDHKEAFDQAKFRDQWVSYTIAYSNGVVRCYRNGQYLGTFNQKISKLEPYAAIGRHWWRSDNEFRSSTRFNGLIDEVKIFCRALSDEEIEKEYNSCLFGLGNSFELVDLPANDSVYTLKFDSVGVGGQFIKTIKIRNKSDANVTLNSVYVTENIHFSIPPSILPLRFAPKEEKEIEIYLLPKLYGKLRDTVVIDDACNPWKVALEGDSFGLPDTLNGQCGTRYEYSIDSINTSYYMSLRAPRYSAASKMIKFDFETNYEGTPLYREVELFNSLGNLVTKANAKVTYVEASQKGHRIIHSGYISLEPKVGSPGVYFIKVENGMVGVVISE